MGNTMGNTLAWILEWIKVMMRLMISDDELYDHWFSMDVAMHRWMQNSWHYWHPRKDHALHTVLGVPAPATPSELEEGIPGGIADVYAFFALSSTM
jgi:hypothetical protein